MRTLLVITLHLVTSSALLTRTRETFPSGTPNFESLVPHPTRACSLPASRRDGGDAGELHRAIIDAAAAAEALEHILEFSAGERLSVLALRGRIRQCRDRLAVAEELLPLQPPRAESGCFECEFEDEATAPEVPTTGETTTSPRPRRFATSMATSATSATRSR